jgi:hypothetical protein
MRSHVWTENPVNAAVAAWLVHREAQSRWEEEPSHLVAQSSQRSVHLAFDSQVLKGIGKQLYGGKNRDEALSWVI